MRFFSLLILASVCLKAETSAPAAEPPALPHIVFIMADDLGYGDPTCNNPNSKIATPNIDRLAKEGRRFTDAHAPAAVCVPTRYGLLTGRYPFRMKRRQGPLIPESETTVASFLKAHGYATNCVGKWHLGVEHEKNPKTGQQLKGGPVDRGFERYFGIPASLDIPPYYYIEQDRCVEAPSARIEDRNTEGWTNIQGEFWRAGGIAPGYKHEEVLPKFIQKSVQYLDDHQKQSPEKPLFLYVALGAPHTPWLPTGRFRNSGPVSLYGDFTRQVDAGVGELLKALDRLKMTENTLVIFTSDNGPVWYEHDVKKYDHSCAGQFRGMKGDAWEGGHRMPFVARWPGTVPAGTVSSETICHVDLLATCAAIIGKPLPETAGVDSYNILPALNGALLKKPIREATVFQSSSRVLAIRKGGWKLIPQLGSGGFSKPRREKPVDGGPTGQLYHLGNDPGETNNVYQDHPEIVKELTDLLTRYKQQGYSRPGATASD